MTLDDAPTPTRRSRRTSGYENVSFEPDAVLTRPVRDDDGESDATTDAAEPDAAAQEATVEDEPASRTAETAVLAPAGLVALTWVDETAVAQRRPMGNLSAVASGYVPAGADLLADLPRRSPWRAGVLAPIAAILLVVAVYAGTTLLWPLHAVAPTVAQHDVLSAPAAAAVPAWPAEGSASVAVAGMPSVLESTTEADSIASITKVVTALVVLDEMPLAPGEAGPDFAFTYGDMLDYWQYRSRGESALDVPVDGTLSQYQMLQGMLIGSANNYADRLSGNLFPSDAVFADAANEWLSLHGVPGVTITEPTGMDEGNSATPAALITLAKKALADPVIAEIVATQQVELPGAGLVENTNSLLADEGVLGIKTGTLARWNLLSAKQTTVAGTPVTMYASVLGQADDEARTAASRAIYSQVESELQPRPSVLAGTVTGQVDTLWGEPVDIVTAEDAAVILWNSDAGDVATTYSLGDARGQGDAVGALSVTGPLDSTSVEMLLAGDIEDPSAWWRLTHPLELFGLAG